MSADSYAEISGYRIVAFDEVATIFRFIPGMAPTPVGSPTCRTGHTDAGTRRNVRQHLDRLAQAFYHPIIYADDLGIEMDSL